MLKNLFANNSMSKTKPVLSRENLESTRSLLLSALSDETDGDRFNAGLEKIANINAQLRRFDEIEEARQQVTEFQQRRVTVSSAEGQAVRLQFLHKCGMIANKVLSKDKGYKGRMRDQDPPSQLNKKMRVDYINKLMTQLTFDQAQAQEDELLTAEIQRRDWLDIVGLPTPTDPRTFGARLNQDGETVG